MTGVIIVLMLLCLILIVLGYWLRESDDAGGMLLLLTLLTMWLVAGIVLHHTRRIEVMYVNKAITICETNGGLKSIDQREAICDNGVTFETHTLKQSEKR